MFDFNKQTPLTGAQVFIEPGQTPEEIDNWFRILHDSGMKICRIRMFELYMHLPDGTWDFKLFDAAFRSAEKYDIAVLATYFPATPFFDIGGFKFPRDAEHQASIREYIKELVNHFKAFSSLAGWVLINEPGVEGILPDTAFTNLKYEEWKQQKASPETNTAGFPIVTFDQQRFLLEYNTWYLSWLANEVHTHDPGRHLHVNNHQIFINVAEYNFPSWKTFLSSFGASAHASWHFGYFKRPQYAVAMSANCEIISSGAGEIPWIMTELQGGNNTYSGFDAMCPTAEEITQWLWTIVGSGGKGAIFWTLNARSSGLEAGEWALLTLQNEVSDRLEAVTEVTKAIDDNQELFANALPEKSGIYILYTRESLWIEKKSQTGGTFYEGRNTGGVMKSALAYFEALTEMGLQPALQEIREFDFSKSDYSDSAIILAHQIAIPSDQVSKLEHFVSTGGKLIVEGLTAYFDEHMHHVMRGDFPLAALFGGNISEFKLIDDLFDFQLDNLDISLVAHLWQGEIKLQTAEALAMVKKKPIASRNQFGRGEVLWIPSLIGLGARLTNYAPLQDFLFIELHRQLQNLRFKLREAIPGLMMRVLKAGDSYILILISKNSNPIELELEPFSFSRIKIIFRSGEGSVIYPGIVHIHPEETIVFLCN